MPKYAPFLPTNSVGSGGETFQILVDKGFEQYDIVLIEAEHLQGSATYTLIEFSTDIAFVNPSSRVATFEGLNKNTPVSSTNYGRFFPWNETEVPNALYCRITPNTEIDNDYRIAIHIVGDS